MVRGKNERRPPDWTACKTWREGKVAGGVTLGKEWANEIINVRRSGSPGARVTVDLDADSWGQLQW